MLTELENIAVYDRNRGVFAAWAFAPPEQRTGLMKSLIEYLNPALQSLRVATDTAFGENVVPLDCPLPPGTAD